MIAKVLESDLTITDVEKLYGEFVELLKEGKDLVLDGSQVEKVDAAALQLLVAVIKEADNQHVKVEWQQPSELLLDSAKLIGVDSYLNFK